MPVVMPARASTVTVNAVAMDSLLPAATIRGRLSASSRSPAMPTQTTPEVWRMKNAIVSAVTNWAAIMRSPSFSRSASSTTTTISPRAIAAIACSGLQNPTGLARTFVPITFPLIRPGADNCVLEGAGSFIGESPPSGE